MLKKFATGLTSAALLLGSTGCGAEELIDSEVDAQKNRAKDGLRQADEIRKHPKKAAEEAADRKLQEELRQRGVDGQ